jgi:osmotically-inducible protein OsmY
VIEEHAEEPKHYVAERVRHALAHDPRTNELDVRVSIVGAKVFVAGSVATHERREAVTVVVEQTLPGHQVCNELTVNDFPEPDHVEELS